MHGVPWLLTTVLFVLVKVINNTQLTDKPETFSTFLSIDVANIILWEVMNTLQINKTYIYIYIGWLTIILFKSRLCRGLLTASSSISQTNV